MRNLKLSLSSSVSDYLRAVISVVVAALFLYLLRGTLSTTIITLLYLLPIVFSTTRWGLGPGVASALFAFLTLNFLFFEPYYTLTVHQAQDVLVLFVFLIEAIVISQLLGWAQSSAAEATARELEATRLYELSAALAGLQDDRAIGRVLAEQAYETFQAAQVEVSVYSQSDEDHLTARLPAQAQPRADQPDALVLLNTARGQHGEIRLWRDDRPIAPGEDRLLRTFATQAALALERARLVESDKRARILEESDRLKSALLSSVSHELRTPLATIKAAVTGLHSGAVSWESQAREDLLAVVEEDVDHLNRLVGNLLDMSRIEAGALKPQRQWNVLAEIVNGTVGRLRRSTERNRLDIDVSEDLPLVPVDPVQMDQVFTNLISNSLKYAPPDTRVYITAQAQADQTLLVRVTNQGPPVPEEHLDRIFDKFYQVTTADRVTGTGLGLSICKGIVETHGGRIWAENLPDGFAFNFTLPLTWDGALPPQLPPESGALDE